MSESSISLAQHLGSALTARKWTVCTAESCTGGGIGAAITDIAGSSQWFEAGFITYSNRIKSEVLGVSAELLAEHGAVSEEVVRAMAAGALDRSGADLAIAVSGVAGPGGGSPAKPVGTVCFGWGRRDDLQSQTLNFDGDRAAVRSQTVQQALRYLIEVSQSTV